MKNQLISHLQRIKETTYFLDNWVNKGKNQAPLAYSM